ncbi:MAG: Gfo/Idh/MocA family oxidoreductase [Ignavibacteriales bacterium]|nr:Gfo/Idh/MocA family oxidoreductase [Ignavibacteriales bacterium]
MKSNNSKSFDSSRRTFIKHVSFGAGALSLGFTSPLIKKIYFQKDIKNKMGVALVGLGNYSTNLLAPALQETEECYLAGIVTGTPSKAEEWSKKYNIPKKNIYNYENFDSIVNNDEIKIVYVVLPNSMHAEFTIRAAKAGKHVICEKPMAINVNECQLMIDACKENNVGLSIGYRMQFERHTIEIIRMAREKEFGDLTTINAGAGFFMRNVNAWRAKKDMGGGAMEDIGIYSLNAARYVTGEEPISVTAQSYNSRPNELTEIDETITFQLLFPSGVIANCMGSFGIGISNLYAQATKGWFGLNPFSSYRGIKGISSNGPIQFTEKNQQAVQMDEMAISFRDNEPLKVTGEEGLKDVRIINAIEESIRTKTKIML